MADLIQQIESEIKGLKLKAQRQNVGVVTEVGDGVARIDGLSDVAYSELIDFGPSTLRQAQGSGRIFGLALNLEQYSVGAVILGDFTQIKQGQQVRTTGRILEVGVGEALVGRVVDALGNPLDGKGPIKTKARYPVEKIAPGVVTRRSVNTPLQTGIKAIDALIPIGRGQRELIIGDRNTGKTTIAIDTIINNRPTASGQQDVICIYVAIGQKTSKVAQLVNKLEATGAMDHTIVVSATASDPVTMQYLAPYAGCAMGEYFMESGKDALIVYDDLSKHAASYRQMSLLLRRPSGREAYPGDVFYLHSRLLERAARMSQEYGDGSLTALPIIETQANDVSAYIPTNVISITDGQIYLEPDLFYAGVRPALNVGISVSRVGGAAQTKAMKGVAGRLKLDLAQFRELQAFAQFAQDLDPQTRAQIDRGRRITEVLKQPPYSPVALEEQVVILWAATNGYLDEVEVEKVAEFEQKYIAQLRLRQKKLMSEIASKKELDEKMIKELEKVTKEFVKTYGKH